MNELHIITIICFLIIVIAGSIQAYFTKRDKSFQKKLSNKVINLIIILSTAVGIGCLLYVYTDTLHDFILTCLMAGGIIGIIVLQDYIKDKIGGYILLSIVLSLVAIYILGYMMAPYLLVEFPHNIIFAMIGAFCGSTIKGSKYRKSLIVIAVSMFAVFLIFSNRYSRLIEELNKPVRYAINYVTEQGYTIGEEDHIIGSSYSNTRNKPIKISIVSISDDYKVMRKIDLIYLNDKIQQMELDLGELRLDWIK